MKRMSDHENCKDGKSSPAEKMAKDDGENTAGPSSAKTPEVPDDKQLISPPPTLADANGVTTALVKQAGISILSCHVSGESCETDSTIAKAGSSDAASAGEKISFTLVFGKEKYPVTESLDENVTDFKEKVAQLTSVPPNMQKLMFKGMLKDGQTLRDAKLTDGCKVMLIGSTPTQIAAANTAPKPEDLRQAEAQAAAKEPLCKQKQHAKVLEKGMPDDVMPGIKHVRDFLPSQPVYGMVNKTGNKVRLTFKLELDQVWLGTKERTEKIPMSQIKDVVSEAIEGHEEYHIMGLQLGPTEASRYWLYWVPAQYVAAIKEAILG